MKNRPLWDKNRFLIFKQEEKLFLRKLTFKKSAKILEALTSPEALKPFKDTSFSDKPLCLKIGLRKQRYGIVT